MGIRIEDLKIGNGVSCVGYGLEFSGKILAIDYSNETVKIDYWGITGQHKRDQWIPIEFILSFTKSVFTLA